MKVVVLSRAEVERLLDPRPLMAVAGGGVQGAARARPHKAMGHVAEDIAAAQLVHAAALREGAGTVVEL
jgi:hypothetical protein